MFSDDTENDEGIARILSEDELVLRFYFDLKFYIA
jgi:hypothetical protein